MHLCADEITENKGKTTEKGLKLGRRGKEDPVNQPDSLSFSLQKSNDGILLLGDAQLECWGATDST